MNKRTARATIAVLVTLALMLLFATYPDECVGIHAFKGHKQATLCVD